VFDAVWVPLATFAITLILVWRLASGKIATMAVDHPNERSLHSVPIPRTGGLGLHGGLLLAWFLLHAGIPDVIPVALLTLIVVSAFDDLRGLPVGVRFTVHVFAGGAVAMQLMWPAFALPGVMVAALGMVWMTNLYNFMDGSDGLAGGMALFGFACYGTAALITGNPAFALLNFSIAAAAVAFLMFNFHPARIFMGDVGSIPLGFLAGSLGLFGWLQNHWPWWFPLVVFSPFIVDASVTLARRLLSGSAIWQAHRDHYYQRLVRMGWGHRRTALAAYGLMGVCGAAAIAGLRWPLYAQVGLLVTIALVYAVLIIVVEIAWRNSVNTRPHDA
jgi:UDP-N-acetylmuramyl pentapeptide phosphotransferase/UDP-N-acetylglucosamine-1-phosphate transferase